MRLAWHALAALAVFALTAPGLGYRHLWQDEIETAERARTILESGTPRVVDRSGALSVNTGGREVEEGAIHRYSPWGQFYWAVPGLAAAQALGASPDAGVRAPFVAAHAATSGLVSYGLTAVAGLSPPVSAALAVGLGLQTVRVVHNRTARYHALLDLLVVSGLLGVGLLGQRRGAGLALVALSVFLLPQVQTLSGAAFALCLGALAAVRLVQLAPAGKGARAALRPVAGAVVLPGLATLVLLLVLTRPWAQSAWGVMGRGKFRSLASFTQLGYAVWSGAVLVPLLAWRRHRAQAVALGVALAVLVVTVRLLDTHPFSQPRYYLAAVFFGLLWPMYAGLEGFDARERRWVAWALAAVMLFPELVSGPLGRKGFLPFHGVRLAWADGAAGATRQPLHLALDYVRTHGRPDDPVLVDYVPQFANWYLPGHPLALLPDPAARTALNAANPMWDRPPPLPRWHVWYSNLVGGLWICEGHCDYTVSDWNEGRTTYVLTSKRLGRSVKMCVAASFPTEKWLNAPFRMMVRAAFRPEGEGKDVLAVATPCEGADEREAHRAAAP